MDFRICSRMRIFIVWLLATALARAVHAEGPSATLEFHIAGGDATAALTEFGRQAHLQLLFDYNIVKGHVTKPLEGLYTPVAALRRLLANTDLEFDFVNERTLAVTQKESPPAPASVAAAHPSERVDHPPARTSHPAVAPADTPVDVVRITGTYVHNEQPVGQELISPSRDEIESTGAANIGDFLSTLPQTFGGGPNQGTFLGQEAGTNSGAGVGVNLRGLGARATLVLINGRRVAPSGTEGEFVDVENIPISAIDHIDILPDSASAIYGADAVGGVVNFVLRDRFDGAETVFHGGSGTRGDLQEYLFSQTLGTSWSGGHGLISFEFYDRGALPAADRAYAVSDLRPFGGGDFDTTANNPGTIINPMTGQTWAVPAGQNGQHLTVADLIAGGTNLRDVWQDAQITPNQHRYSLYATGRQAINDRMSVFTDVLLAHREASSDFGGVGGQFPVPSSNAFYPVGLPTSVLVSYNFGKDLGLQTTTVGVDTLNTTLGLDLEMGTSWALSLYASFVREKENQLSRNLVNFNALETALADSNPATAFNPFGDGSNTNPATLASIRANSRFWLNSQLRTLDLTADGPIAQLPGGPLKLALGADRREQEFDTIQAPTAEATEQDMRLSRGITSFSGEVRAPLVSEKNALPAIARLELSAAARYEDYSVFGSYTTPKLGMVWAPVPELALRATWSRAVRPPTLVDLDTGHNQVGLGTLADPTAPGGVSSALVLVGGNPEVQPERARSWTAGLDLVPAQAPGLSMSLTYFETVFSGRIQSPDTTGNVLTEPADAPFVTHNPTTAQIAALCSQGTYVGGTQSQCIASGAQALVDTRVRNLARLLTRGIDFNTGYRHPLPLGTLQLGLNGSYLLSFSQADSPDQPLQSVLSTQNEPINLRMRATAGWGLGGFSTLVAANFANGYHDTASIPQRRIDSWTTIDLQLRYDFPERSGWLHGTRLVLNARNVFNVDPPFLNNQLADIGYDQENANPYGRVLSLEIRKRW